MDKLLTAEGFASLILAFGGAVMILKRLGFVQFGRKSSPAPPACPDPECKDAIQGSISGLRQDFKDFKNDTYPKINDTAQAVSRIEGYIEGLQNGRNPK